MFKLVKYRLLLTIFALFFLNANLSYSQLFNFTNYTPENGFPQSDAFHILQDNEGYLWFSTQNGAVKFDGINFKVYNKSNGFKSNVVSHILQDKNGRYWFSTRNGLTKLENNKFTSYTKEDGLLSEHILKTFELADSSILVSTKLGCNIIKNNNIEVLSKEIIPVEIISRKNNETWVITNNDILIYNDKLFTTANINKNIVLAPYSDFVEDINSNLYLATSNGIYKISNEKIIHFNEDNGLINNDINRLLIDSDNNLWYSSEQKGCGFLKNNKFYNITINSGLTNHSVHNLFEDNENNIWIGGRNGATMINTKIPFIHYDKISPYENEIVMGMLNDKKNNIWFCTYGFGISKYDGNEFQTFNKQNGNIENQFFDVEEDKYGNLWFASGNKGIIKFDGKNFKKVKINGKYIDTRVLTIYKDSKENLWFGTNGKGVFLYNNKKIIKFEIEGANKLKDVMSICEDDNKNIWFGSIDKGLFKYDGKNLENLLKENNFGFIRTIVNRNSNIWIGTSSNGIYKISKINGKYEYKEFTKKDGITSNNIYVLFVDSKDNLWCGSEKGVDKLIFKDDSISKIKNYTRDEGFIGIETNINGALEDKKGNIWFGTVNGAVKYNESADKTNTVENKTYITGIRLFFEKPNWSEYSDSVNNKNIPVNLKLPYNKNHLSFNFIGLCYSSPKKVKYKYRLLGQSDNWSPASSDNKAIFTNITPGHYEFQVKSANNDGIWNSEAVSYNFIINPPYWEKIWFRTLLMLIFLIILYFGIDFRIRSLRKSKTKLEIKINERTSELLDQKEELQTTNNRITDSINYAGKIQSAMLPSVNIFENNFSEYFIINYPRDIVSGDFYWAREFNYKEESHIITVVADCTGHGIPGALVSMLGMSLLNEIIRKDEVTQANQVLEELRKEIKLSLNQKGELNDQTEGIDMTICSLNKKTKELQFSGANNPLYIIRKGELKIYKPTINPVGIFIKEIPFKNTTIQLQKDDTLYMFTDGYVDQFNGKTAEKFKISRFRELLLSIKDKSMIEQKEILENTYSDWKQDFEQIDDILIVGLKI